MKKPLKQESIKRACMRCIRVAVAIFLTGILIYASEDPRYIALVPFINGIAKYVREQYGIDIKVL